MPRYISAPTSCESNIRANGVYNSDRNMEIIPGGHLYIEFIEHKNKVKIVHAMHTWGLTYPVFFTEYNDWTVIRLDRERFVIELNKNNKNYRVGFTIGERVK